MTNKRLLMIGTDRKIFEQGSAVRARQIEYAKKFDEVHIIVFRKSKEGKKEKGNEGQSAPQNEVVLSSNCWAYSTQSRSKWRYSFDAIRLGRFIVSKRAITDITCQDPFQTGMVGVSLKKQFPQVQLELQVHTDIGSPYFTYTLGNKIRKALALSYLPKADHVRVVSNKIKNYLIGVLKIDDSKIEVRPIAVDTEKIKNAQVIEGADLHKKYPQFDKIILMASRLEPEKNINLALEGFAEVLKHMPNAGLVIVGSGSHVLKPAPSVVFESWADQATLFSYYKTADVFLLTSLFEGYGLTLAEAQAVGCKIVSTDVGIARELGAVIVEYNKESVAKGIMSALV